MQKYRSPPPAGVTKPKPRSEFQLVIFPFCAKLTTAVQMNQRENAIRRRFVRPPPQAHGRWVKSKRRGSRNSPPAAILRYPLREQKCGHPSQFAFYAYLHYCGSYWRKREYLGQLELMVLLAVMRPAGDAYGVLISRDIAEKSGREVALASVYAALERLERKGFVRSLLGEPTAERGGKARTYFTPTAAGLKEARDACRTLMRLSSGIPTWQGELA